MPDVFFNFIFSLFFSIGVVFSVVLIFSYINEKTAGCIENAKISIVISGRSDGIEYAVKTLASAAKQLHTKDGPPEFVVCFEGDDEEAQKICELICNDYPFIKLEINKGGNFCDLS